MAINRAQIRDLLLPGLAGIEGKYPQIPTQWSQIFVRANSKMALERKVEARYLSLAQNKNEGGPTPFDNAAGERFVYNIDIFSFGLGFAQTRESLADNLYKDSFHPSAMGLVESFQQTKEIVGANILNTATTFNANIQGDGKSLVNTAHPIDGNTYANQPATDIDLNESALETALNAIRVFPDQAGLKTFARGRKLVVPYQLNFVAERLTKTELRTGTADNDVNAIMSSGALPDGYIVNDFLTSSFAWFVLSNVKGLVCYDREPFEMDLQIDPTTGNLLCIGFERYGFGYYNPRALWGTFPTA